MAELGMGLDIAMPAFLAALVVAALLSKPIFKTLLALKSRQTVSQYVPEHAAKQGTPTMGGIIIAVGFLGGLIATLVMTRPWVTEASWRYYLATVVLFVVFALIGFVDDFVVPRLMKGKRGLGWTQKLVMQILGAASFVAILGRSMPPLEIAGGILLILFFSNAYNFSDGLDALAGSLLLAICLGLAFFGMGSENGIFPVLAALAGGCLPFLWLNRPPARIFMGDVGALPIGAVLGAVVAAVSLPYWSTGNRRGLDRLAFVPGHTPTAPVLLALAILSFVMIAELVPVPLQILSVKLRNKRIFPATPIHHSFQRAGWKEIRVVTLFVGVQLLCSLVAAVLLILTWRGQ